MAVKFVTITGKYLELNRFYSEVTGIGNFTIK